MQEHYASGQLQFTDNVKAAVKDAEVVYLAVGTPSKADGTVDMSYLEAAGKEVCDALAANRERIPGDDRRQIDRPRRDQPQALQIPQGADQGPRTGRLQPRISPRRLGRSGFPRTRPHRHRRRKPRSLPHDAPPVRSDRQARRSLHDHELGIGRADQVRRQRDARRPHFVHERDDDSLRSITTPTSKTSAKASAPISASAPRS